ncbi:hypothetical protein GX441_12205 [bacterium]|nr:hypothetical protein [bacterium]
MLYQSSLIITSFFILSAAPQAQAPFLIEELDSSAVAESSETWFNIAETGQKVIENLDFYLVVSPDQRWIIMGKPVEGLDVVTYKLYLISIYDANLRLISEQALGATFSPTSDFIFIPSGMNPMLYDLKKHKGLVISNISSGLENYPSWVSEWSEDGLELVIRQQLRFDDSSSKRAWRITLK